jgi:hypothetical protein
MVILQSFGGSATIMISIELEQCQDCAVAFDMSAGSQSVRHSKLKTLERLCTLKTFRNDHTLMTRLHHELQLLSQMARWHLLTAEPHQPRLQPCYVARVSGASQQFTSDSDSG